VSFASRGALVDGPRAASVFGLSLLAAVLWPTARENWRAARRDSFPLFYYPMFSARRRKRVRVTHLVGFDARGGRHLLPCRHVASGGLNQVRKQIRRSVEAGEAETLCAALAARLARAATPAPLESVAIVTGEYRLDAWFAGERAPVSEVVHASAPVPAAATVAQ